MGEPFEHPDLRELGRELQRQFDAVAEAENEAARVMARRMNTLRDRLLDAEDAGLAIDIGLVGGFNHGGVVVAVALDHVELRSESGAAVLIPFDTILSVVME